MNPKMIQRQITLATLLAQDQCRSYSELTPQRYIRLGLYGLMSQSTWAIQAAKRSAPGAY